VFSGAAEAAPLQSRQPEAIERAATSTEGFGMQRRYREFQKKARQRKIKSTKIESTKIEPTKIESTKAESMKQVNENGVMKTEETQVKTLKRESRP
jgi:hypothetical protein